MSIRIYNESLSGTAASQTNRADEVSRAGTSGKTGQSATASGEDQVQISSLSENIAAQSASRAGRVQHLAALYQSGRYEVNSTNVANAMVSSALQAGGTESGT